MLHIQTITHWCEDDKKPPVSLQACVFWYWGLATDVIREVALIWFFKAYSVKGYLQTSLLPPPQSMERSRNFREHFVWPEVHIISEQDESSCAAQVGGLDYCFSTEGPPLAWISPFSQSNLSSWYSILKNADSREILGIDYGGGNFKGFWNWRTWNQRSLPTLPIHETSSIHWEDTLAVIPVYYCLRWHSLKLFLFICCD